MIAAPVVRAPSERIFGAETVGRHHDPFTVMQQFERPARLGLYSQPVTDLTGAAIARVTGAVAAYNWLVLLSFPLSAAAAYLLARHLALPPFRRAARGAAVRRFRRFMSPMRPTIRMSRRSSGSRCICWRCGAAWTRRAGSRWRRWHSPRRR